MLVNEFNFNKTGKLMCSHCGCYVILPIIGKISCPKCGIDYVVRLRSGKLILEEWEEL